MLLTETIQKSTGAIRLRRKISDDKTRADAYFKALLQLDKAVRDIERDMKCAAEIKNSGISAEPVLTEELRDDLLGCIDSCGRGLSQDSEEQLTVASVKLLQSKGDAAAAAIRQVWKDAAGDYAKGAAGYLSMISGLTDNPRQARELVEEINKTVEGCPSVKAVSNLVSDVEEAKEIADSFSISPQIEGFLKKVSSQRATIADLTPEVAAWLKEKHLTGKLKIRF